MQISDWFTARDARRYTKVSENKLPREGVDVPDGVWIKCDSCHKTMYEGEAVDYLYVCRSCGHHMAVTAPQRIEMLTDGDSFVEIDADLSPADPLGFVGTKSYQESLAAGREKSGLEDAVLTGTATLGGHDIVFGVMDFRFIGASMGSVVGERIARAFELATERRLPIVLVIASGGARMQEGMLSLMQMAKTSAAAKRHGDAGLLYLSVLTNPTYGGVTASFAVLADIIVAEPGALVGFAGQRVIEQTIRQKPPKGFQTSEFMLKHGMIDEVVKRSDLRAHLTLLLDYLVAPSTSKGVR